MKSQYFQKNIYNFIVKIMSSIFKKIIDNLLADRVFMLESFYEKIFSKRDRKEVAG